MTEAVRAVTDAAAPAGISGEALAEITNPASTTFTFVSSIAAAEEQSATSGEITKSWMKHRKA